MDNKCECARTTDGNFFICPKHYEELIKNSHIRKILEANRID